LEEDLKTGDPKEAIDTFLANIGHNISKSVIAESTASNETRSQRTDNLPDPDESMNLSNWQPSNESSILEEMTQPTHPYRSRKVGVTAHVQEERERRPNWMSKKCTSCGKGFNSLSRPLQCKGCDTWSHNKSKCLSEGAQRNSEYNCKTCKPASAQTTVVKHSQNEHMKFTKENNKFKCNICDYSSKAKFNIKRHIKNNHGEQGDGEVNAHVINEDIAPNEEIEVDVV